MPLPPDQTSPPTSPFDWAVQAVPVLMRLGLLADWRHLSEEAVIARAAAEMEKSFEAVRQDVARSEATPGDWWRLDVILMIEANEKQPIIWWTDLESDAQPDYVEAIEELALISRGAFEPTNIKAEWSPDFAQAIVTFHEHEKRFVFHPAVDGDWLDVGVIDVVNTITAPRGIDMLIVEPEDQTAQFIALTAMERRVLEEERSWRFLSASCAG